MSSTRKFAILVVDDDAKIGELIQTFFTLKNSEVTCVMASDVQQALSKLSNQEFDLILIDNIMPRKSGLDLALILKRSVKYARTPIVLMSGSIQQDDVLKAMQAGVKDILVKPFTLNQLNDKIHQYFKK